LHVGVILNYKVSIAVTESHRDAFPGIKRQRVEVLLLALVCSINAGALLGDELEGIEMLPQHPKPRTCTTDNESFEVLQFEGLPLVSTVEQFAHSSFITYYKRLRICAQLQQDSLSRKDVTFGVI
jgi:hypothetical protein